jgi:mannose-6-phosphate isomerase
MNIDHQVLMITGVPQHYEWGGTHFIPALIGRENPEQKPFAELWLGAHDKAPSIALDSGETLGSIIAHNPEKLLGTKAAQYFQQKLPYLLKILDVRQMLSIQAHPTKVAAEIGFAEENAAGIPIDAPHRNYKDDNHKPEMMLALSDFWLLHGFRSPREIEQNIEQVPEFQPLLAHWQGDIRAFYQYLMEMPQEQVNTCLQPLAKRLIPLYESQQLDKTTPDFWAARAAITYNRKGICDRGIFSIYLFNLVHLHVGEAIFQGAGIPHAYLEGQNVELMANSDNVLRGGLTPKHIDVPELMKHLHFEEVVPQILRGKPNGSQVFFEMPVPDFALYQVNLGAQAHTDFDNKGASIVLVTAGAARLSTEAVALDLTKGQAAFVAAEVPFQLSASAECTIYVATDGI